MKLQVFGVLAVLLLVLSAVPVKAQFVSHVANVNIPFDFAVGNETLPQGEYTVTNNRGLIQISGSHLSIYACASQTEKRGGKNAAELVFHRINNQYFLAEIWMGDDRDGRKLSASKRERELTAQAVETPEVEILSANNVQ